MNPASTRFAMEASKRRRQRKQQQLSENDRKVASNDSDASGGAAGVGLRGDENVQREDKQNKDKCQPLDLACATTLSTTFDDSTVSSKDFSKSSSDSWRFQYASRGPSQPPSQVTTSNESFNFAGAMPPRSISCHTKMSENNNKSVTICTSSTTPRRVNLGPNHNKLKRDGTELTVNTTSLNHSEITKTPKNNNLSATPKHNTYTTSKQLISNDDSFSVMSAVTTLEQVKVLTEERDKFRSDVALFKGKLNNALEKKAAAIQQKENAVCDYEGRLMKQAKELELAKAQKQYAEYQLKVMEKKMNEHNDDKVLSLREEVKSVSCKMKESLDELARVQENNHILKKKKDLVETRENALKNELKQVKEDRNRMRSWMNESSERLQHMQIECQQKDMQQAQSEKTIKDLQCEKQKAQSEYLVQLSSAKNQLSKALAEKQCVEKSLQHEILNMQNELLTQKSNCESIKQQHSSIVEGLKSELVTSQQLKEESVSSIQKDLDLMKRECDNRMAHCKNEVEKLRSQLNDTNARADVDRKEWEHSLRSQYEHKLNAVREVNDSLVQQLTQTQNEIEDLRSQLLNIQLPLKNENESLAQQLNQAQKDIDCIKSVRDEDIRMHKSELEKTHQEKVQIESEFKELLNIQRPLENENKSLAQQLNQAQKDIDCIKSVRDEDIRMLKSELEKTHQEKVQIESEFKETTQQLHVALRNLNEMGLDGARMRDDLEGFLNDFTKETNRFQKEMDHMKKVNEEQHSQLRNLKSKNEQYEYDCTMVRKHVSSLEEKLLTREKVSDGHKIQLQHLKIENEKYEHECNELRKNVSLLEERLLTRGQVSDEHRMQLQDLKMEKEQIEHECNELRQSITSFEERLTQEREESKRHQATQFELSEKNAKISQLEAETLRLSTQIAQLSESVEQLRSTQREKSLELSRAQQMIQVLKSKERYLESMVDSLADQISKTVRDYEMRISSSSSGENSDADQISKTVRDYEMRISSSSSGENSD